MEELFSTIIGWGSLTILVIGIWKQDVGYWLWLLKALMFIVLIKCILNLLKKAHKKRGFK